MARFTQHDIEEIYQTHPLRKETILGRLKNQRGSYAGVTEIDLAEDPLTEISDQNHLGGLAFTRQLAERTGISSTSRVLDLGCGLGGSARCLAWLYGCRVHGIDLSAQRVREARELTKLVGLDHLVTFDCADVMTIPLPEQPFDVLWGQGAWVHLEHKRDFLRKWTTALAVPGRLAVEDVCVLRQPGSGAESDLLAALEDRWKSYLVPLDGDGGWKELIEGCDLVIELVDDSSADLLGHFLKLKVGATHPEAAAVSEFEQDAWRLAIESAEAGLIGYFRLVADKRAVMTSD
jgi:SAM-dependent methyltransferase